MITKNTTTFTIREVLLEDHNVATIKKSLRVIEELAAKKDDFAKYVATLESLSEYLQFTLDLWKPHLTNCK